MERLPALQMRQIVKTFGVVTANDHVDFEALPGEIHALLGENGAGKSTLMCQLSGVYRPTSGEILLDGRPVRLNSPWEASQQGIGMVFQNFRLVPTLTALENILLGEKAPFWHGSAWKKSRRVEIEAFAQRLGLNVPLDTPVELLAVGEQQRVEIVKTLYRGARFIILDEPTSVLTPQEVEDLFHTLRRLKAEGKTILITTHKLKEVMALADRISVLRKGRLISTIAASQTNEKELAQMMVGEQLEPPRPRGNYAPGEVLLSVKDLEVHADHGGRSLSGFHLEVRAGEIVGVAGVSGNGQKELAEVLTGLRPWKKGHIVFQGQELRAATVRSLIEAGMAHVPENRMKSGLAGSLNVIDNLLFKSYRLPERSRWGFLRLKDNRSWSRDLVEEFSVRTPSLDTPVQHLSGGNQQKLLLAREIRNNPRLMIAVHPTQGLDVGATQAVHDLLEDLRNAGKSVLLISEDLDEVLELSDRILVLFNGKVAGEVSRAQADRHRIGMWMAGLDQESP